MKKNLSKKEIQQIAAMGVMVLAGVIYGVWALLVVPMRKSGREQAVKLADLEKKNAQALTAVALIPDHEERLTAINDMIVQIAENYAVRPILGSSYQLGLRALLDPLAHASGFSLQAMVVQSPAPMPQKRPGAPLTLCTAEIRGAATYQQIRDFIAAIEASNPYIHVTGLIVTTDPKNIRKHRVTLKLECVSAPAEPKRL